MNNFYKIWISRMRYITFEIFDELLCRYKSVEQIYGLDYEELSKNEFLNKNVIFDILNPYYKLNIDKYESYMEKHKIIAVSCYDKDYPYRLNLIENKPIVIFAKGNYEIINNESVAMVGSRKCSSYGRAVTRNFAGMIAKKGVNIVSGLAVGIDCEAHKTCIEMGGTTVAVLGNGLDSMYPKCNEILAQKIIDHGGLLISEYPIGMKPLADNFPRRNRIISGISDMVIVVEASEKSGSLITADYATNQGKDVWVVPGNINSLCSVGSNELIRDGAKILCSINDILR